MAKLILGFWKEYHGGEVPFSSHMGACEGHTSVLMPHDLAGDVELGPLGLSGACQVLPL